MTTQSHRSTRSIAELDQAECEQLLTSTPIGRMGFDFAGTPVILPVNFRYVNGDIVFRTSTGRKLHAVAANKRVAFEVDQWDAWNRIGRSVLVVGEASEIQEWEQLQQAEDLGLHPWAETADDDRWVRITPERITGRRIG